MCDHVSHLKDNEEEGHGGIQPQWSRAHEILHDMKKKRESFVVERSPPKGIVVQQQQHPESPTVIKLGTLHEYEATETDRAREILNRMKNQREHFSKLLVGSHSPTPTSQSLTRTESTAALSWVSSSSEEEQETHVFSEEEASNDYDDYGFHSSDDDSCSSNSCFSTSSKGSAITFYSDGSGNSSDRSSVLTSSSLSSSVVRALNDIRCLDVSFVDLPNPLTSTRSSKALSSQEHQKVLERRNSETSRARCLYQEKTQTYRYLKREQTGPITTRLRADLAAISERRAVLSNMLRSMQEQESEEIDFGVVASTILSNSQERITNGRPPRPSQPKPKVEQMTVERVPSTQQPKPSDPVLDLYKSATSVREDARGMLLPLGFPVSERRRGPDGSDAVIEWSDSLEDLVKEESVRESLYYSESSRASVDDSSLPPAFIEFKARRRFTETEPRPHFERPKALRSAEYLKSLYSPKPEETYRIVQTERYGGLYHIAILTDDVEKLTDRTHIASRKKRRLPMGIIDEFRLPYNVEDRFCGGMYQIASQTRPPPSKMGII